jgi:MFS transporter, DHA1 family, tetracycline resistance protein
MAFIALQGLVQPSLMAMLSRRATPETQGEIQGVSAMTLGLGSIIAPVVLTTPMAYFTGPSAPIFFPGAPYIVAAVFGVVALVMLRRLPRVTPA